MKFILGTNGLLLEVVDTAKIVIDKYEALVDFEVEILDSFSSGIEQISDYVIGKEIDMISSFSDFLQDLPMNLVDLLMLIINFI